MNYEVVLKTQNIENYIGESKIVALDIETSPSPGYRKYDKAALDAHKSTITGISFSVKEGTGIYVPFRHKDGNNAKFIPVWTWIQNNILMDKERTVVIHNAAFESMFFYALGCVPQCKIYDTMAAAQMTLKSEKEFRKLSDSGLKTLVPELLKVDLPTFGDVTEGKHFDMLNSEDKETIRYACADSDYALRLYHVFNNWFDENLPKHRKIVEEIESPTSVYVGIMRYNGILMDEGLMFKKQKEAESMIRQIKEDIILTAGDIDIGINAATEAFKKYLYEDLQLPVLKTTETFKRASDDETLMLLSAWCKENRPEIMPLFEMVQEYRKWNKIKSTYIDGYLSHLNKATGRIHPDLMPLGTETGRFASRNPNLQNSPRKDNDPIGVRKFIIAPEGKVLMSLDFSQIELRVGAFYCRDGAMLETYETGGDIHAKTTSVIFNIPFEQAVDKNAPHYKERRTIAKNCNFGVFFGLFPKGLQRTLKFKAGLDKSFDECKEIIYNLKAGYPKLAEWQKKEIIVAKLKGYTETLFGRRRYLPDITSIDWGKKSYSERCALNTPIQGTAAELLKLAMGRIIQGLPVRSWLRPILQIHDELVFELPESRVNEALTFIKECMEKGSEDFDVPLVAEASVGKNFGTMDEMQ